MHTDDNEEQARRTAQRQPFIENKVGLWRWWLLAALVTSVMALTLALTIILHWEPEIKMRTISLDKVSLEQSPTICFDTYRDAAAYYNISNSEALRIPVPDECKY